jgi:hypothetical protein
MEQHERGGEMDSRGDDSSAMTCALLRDDLELFQQTCSVSFFFLQQEMEMEMEMETETETRASERARVRTEYIQWTLNFG